MMHAILPGPDGSSVPKCCWIQRIGAVSVSDIAMQHSTAPPSMFELSSKDKEAGIPRLSVFVHDLTTADEAWAILGGNPKNTVVACANVETVNQVFETDKQKNIITLVVQWERAASDSPGAAGHCGIANLNIGDKVTRRTLRSKLADAFRLSPVPVPHNFQDEELRVTAYYISIGDADNADHESDQERNWYRAIRELRRLRSSSLRRSECSGID